MSNYALITGASRGLGKSIAYEFFKRDYGLILNGRDRKRLDSFLDELKGGEGLAVVGDLKDDETINKLAYYAKENKVSVLVNNAGIYLKKPVTEMNENEVRDIINTNFFSAVNLTQRILPIFISNGSGTIININSVAGDNGSYGESAYAASKHALNGFFDSMRYEVTKNGIRIINVVLGAMQTDMSRGRDDWENFISPEEAAKLIVSSCTDYKTLCPNEIKIGRMRY